MKSITTIFCVVTTLLWQVTAFAAPLSNSPKPLKIGIIEYPPHIHFNQQTLDGRAIKYVRRALEKQFKTIEFIKLPSKRAQVQLSNGKLDLLLPLTDDQHNFKRLTKPLFHAIPGLCFKKQNFIPILSATHRLKGLSIGVPVGVNVVSTLQSANAKLQTIEGSKTLDNGINLLLGGLIDVLYHPNPIKVYHHSNPLSKKIACSYFHGESAGVFIAVKPQMDKVQYQLIDEAFTLALRTKSYEFYFAEHQ